MIFLSTIRNIENHGEGIRAITYAGAHSRELRMSNILMLVRSEQCRGALCGETAWVIL